MLEVTVQLNGKKIDPKRLSNEIEKAALAHVITSVEAKLRNIKDPETGERPKVKIVGRSLDKLEFQISASSDELRRRAVDALK